MSAVVERARWFSYGRQRLNRAGRDPQAVLSDVVGVHSTQPTAPLSLLARCEPFTAEAFRDLDALRLPAMRGSIHLLPRATAHLAFAALPAPEEIDAAWLEQQSLSEADYAGLRSRLLDAAREPRTARELREDVAADRPLAPMLAALTRAGSLVRLGAHGLRSNELFYVAAHLPAADADEALEWLAGEYLRAFGPARLEDFAWWAGVPAERARAALAPLPTEALDGGWLLRTADVAAFERSTPLHGSVDLLPRWDAYAMGYAPDGRGRFADADIVEDLYDEGGEARPVVLVEGNAIGTWGVRPGSDLEFELDLYEKPSPSLHRALDDRAAAIRALLS